MPFRSFSRLTMTFLALLVVTICTTFGAVRQTAEASSSSCSSALAPCNSQSELGQSYGSPVGRSTLKGPPGLAGPDVSDPNYNDFYADGYQWGTVDGAEGYFGQYAPKVVGGKTRVHSLAELAVEDANQNSQNNEDVVEVGWMVDPHTYNDGRPHLFVFSWVDGKPGCYSSPSNWCGFVPYSGAITPGKKLPVDGKTHEYAIEHLNGEWRIWYDTQWIGYFPDTHWPHGFTQGSLTQWFGEVAVPKPQSVPCSIQMGDGLFGHSNGSAVITNMALIVNGQAYYANAQELQPTPRYYDVGHMLPQEGSFNSFTYGGPGGTAC